VDRASRRGFLTGLLALPVAFLGAKAVGAVREAGRIARPHARGTSTTRCAVCGSAGHAMLRCPSTREVL
jgi:hypothetical protein